MRTPQFTAAIVAVLLMSPTHLPIAAAQGVPADRVSVRPAQFPTGRAVPRDRFNQVFSQGYQRGIREGERDARSRRARDFRRHNDYRRAGGFGNSRSGEADAFRRGFAQGYAEGYDRAGRGGWGAPVYRGPGFPNQGYPGRGYPGGGYGYLSPAMERGFDDGFRDGMNAARRNQRYDPVRERRYRSGDAGYNSRFGPRERYRTEYRNAYRQGYDRGYQEGRWR